MPHPRDVNPHPDAADYTRVELESAIDFTDESAAKLVDANGKIAFRPRSCYITNTGGGTLIVTTEAGNERIYHNLEAGKFLEPAPLVLKATKAETSTEAVAAFILVDDDTQTSTFTGWADDTTDANDAGTADVLFMPATEATADGFLVGMAEPFNALEVLLSTNGGGGTITWKYYTGDRTTYDATWTALSGVTGGAKNLTHGTSSAGTVSWKVPSDWVPCNINSYGDYYWVYGNVASTYTTNPVGTQVWAKNKTNVGGIRVGA